MMIKLHDLKTLTTRTPGGEEARIQGVYLNDAFAVQEIAADLKGLLDLRVVAMPAAAFSTPDLEAGIWPADIPTDAIQRCHVIGDKPDTALATVKELVFDTLPDQMNGLRSGASYKGLSLDLNEGPAGRILDLVVDTDTMTVPHMVVETGSWLPERQVLLPTAKVTKVDWSARKVYVDANQADITSAPDVFENDQLTTKGSGTLLTYYGISA